MKHTRHEEIQAEYLRYLDELPVEKVQEQIERQEEGIIKGRELFKKKDIKKNKEGKEIETNRFRNSHLLNKYISKFVEDIKKELNNKHKKQFSFVKPFLNEEYKFDNKKGKMISPEAIAYIVTTNILSSTNDKEITLTSIAKKIYRDIMIQKRDNIIKVEKKGLYKVLKENTRTDNVFKRYQNNIVRAEQIIERKKEEFGGLVNTPKELDSDTQYKMGLFLIDLFMNSNGSIEKTNIQKMTRSGIKTISILVFRDEVLKYIEKIKKQMKDLRPVQEALVIKPKPWTNLTNGGYFTETELSEIFDFEDDSDFDFSTLRNLLIRTNDRKAVKLINDYSNLDEVYDCVNSIQNVSWQVNKKVFTLFEELKDNGFYNSKGDKILEGIYGKDLPQPLNEDEKDQQVILKYRREAGKIHNENKDTLSERMTNQIKYDILKRYSKLDEFYFTWNVDYRSRVYPIQKLVNPQGDDLIKACLKFKKGKELGKDGLYWLKVQCANVAGVDKETFDDRVKWVDENLKMIRIVGENPIDNLELFSDLDKPFQFVAVAEEINEALKLQDPSKFVSYLAVALDGSNSGLQHWSAMLLDEESAKSVNVLPTEKPADVYEDVAKELKNIIEKDLKGPNAELAKIWLESDYIDRSLCKRPTMTTPYSVTEMGIMDQIKDYLKKKNKTDILETKGSLKYIKDSMVKALNIVIKGAREGMKWLQEVSDIVSKEYGENLYWETPTGFIVHQSYYKTNTKLLNTFFGGVRLRPSMTKKTNEVNKNKSSSGIAPNFIHSYDATHLIKTTNKMFKNRGVESMWLIHDSFGTYAADTQILHNTIKEEFVEIYKEDQLLNLKKQIEERYPDIELPALPKKGRMDIYEVLKSLYIFS